jgi:hypothetical protein
MDDFSAVANAFYYFVAAAAIVVGFLKNAYPCQIVSITAIQLKRAG